MTFIIAALCAVILCWLHTRALVSQRQTLEDRLDNQAQRHAQDLRKIVESATIERTEWHRTLTAERTTAQAHITEILAAQATERDRWLEERTQLLNRIKPETAQTVTVPGEFFAPPALDLEDDHAFYEDKEAMADRLAQTELQLAKLAAGAV